jgi:hypothetical protein
MIIMSLYETFSITIMVGYLPVLGEWKRPRRLRLSYILDMAG